MSESEGKTPKTTADGDTGLLHVKLADGRHTQIVHEFLQGTGKDSFFLPQIEVIPLFGGSEEDKLGLSTGESLNTRSPSRIKQMEEFWAKATAEKNQKNITFRECELAKKTLQAKLSKEEVMSNAALRYVGIAK